MERRDFLKLGGSTALFAAGAGWLLTRDQRIETPLDRAMAQARRNGKPVLVLVAPPPPVGSAELSDAFADALDFGGDELLVAVMLAEVVCATAEQVFETLGVASIPNDVGLIEIEDQALHWRRIDFDARSVFVTGADPDVRDARNAEALRAALVGDDALLTRRAQSVRSALGDERIAALDARLASGDALDEASLIEAAAWIRAHPTWDSRRTATVAAARARVLVRPPRGARWAQHSGCSSVEVSPLPSDDLGVRYDLHRRANGDSPAFQLWPGRPIPNPLHLLGASGSSACGMAFGGGRAARFLVFYVDEP